MTALRTVTADVRLIAPRRKGVSSMRKGLLAAAALAAFAPVAAGAALAANWYRVTLGSTAAWYVDLNSIHQNGQWTFARQYSVNFEASASTGVKSAWSDTEFDCKARTMRYGHFSASDASGKELASMDNPDNGEIHPIEANTVVADIADYVCNVDRSHAVKVADPLTDTPPRT